MPRTQNRSLNLGPIRNACKFIKECWFGLAVYGVILSGVGYGLYALVSGIHNDSVLRQDDGMAVNIINDVKKARSVRMAVSRLNFHVTDAHQVIHVQGKNRYILDFNTEIITIDGPDDADAVIPFSDFSKQSFIEDSREAAIWVSDNFDRQLAERLSEEETQFLAEGGYFQGIAQDWITATRKDVEIFKATYGAEATLDNEAAQSEDAEQSKDVAPSISPSQPQI